MLNLLIDKFKEALYSILPVTFIVLLISIFTDAIPLYSTLTFLFGSLFLIFGMCFFTLGADISMIEIGEKIGSKLTKRRNFYLILVSSFILGAIVTIAEPDLRVLASQVPSIDPWIVIMTIGIGVGLFLVVSSLRILFQFSLIKLLVGMYLLIFIIAFFVPSNFVPLGFDAGGVTTGPLSVPLIMAFGVGLSKIRSDSKAKNDSFGLLALCSAGPILMVLLLGLIFKADPSSTTEMVINTSNSIEEIIKTFFANIPTYMLEVGYAMLPIVVFFAIFQRFYLKLRKRERMKIIKGLIYTYIGLVIFLVGANIGFMPVGYLIGNNIGGSSFKYILIPIGVIIGFFLVQAEPAVQVLKEQVEDITQGNVTSRTLGIALSIGVGISVGLAMIRVLMSISIWYFLIPFYLFAIIMAFVVPEIFTAIAFDSGGVASGTMTATFLLPLAIGATIANGGSVLIDAFGLVALVSMTPLITVQLMGLIYKIKTGYTERSKYSDDEIIINYDSNEEVSL